MVSASGAVSGNYVEVWGALVCANVHFCTSLIIAAVEKASSNALDKGEVK